MRTLLALILTLWASAAVAQPAPLLHAMFRDHAVLQRDRPILVWGRAAPGETVTVSLGGVSATATAEASGRWSAALPAVAAGGPFVLTARGSGGASQTVNDVLVGDVWLCSGQSNMAFLVRQSANAGAEIAASANDSIRMLTVETVESPTPVETFTHPGDWRPAGPDSTGAFSAACYYFARELQKTVKVPMGLVNASWGGANIQTFISEPSLRALGGFGRNLDILDLYATDRAAANRMWGQDWQAWWKARYPAGGEPWAAEMDHPKDWRAAPPELGYWETWGVPELAAYDGLVWYRTTVRLTAAQAARHAVLTLGPVDEVDQTWVNGQAVGFTSGPGTDRRYELADGVLKAGDNVVVVAALDTYGNGGIYGPAEKRALQLADGASVPLAGPWLFQIAPTRPSEALRAPWEATGGLTTIRNGMITPIGPYGLRGALWYQGESNTGDPDRYQALLRTLMADWRGQFGKDLPFLVVQLPNYGPLPKTPGESGWAGVRQAEQKAVAEDAHAGLAVTIDVGEAGNLHPPNKQDVGRRLARAVRHVVYGEAIAPSGPVAVSAHRESGKVVVQFRDVEDRLQVHGADGLPGFELCGAGTGSCRYVAATILGDRVALDAGAAGAAARVRYCWADSPVCTLFDRSGLPAGPFELPIQ